MIKFARFILVKATLLTICLAFILAISVISSPHTYAASTAYNTPSVAQDHCSPLRSEISADEAEQKQLETEYNNTTNQWKKEELSWQINQVHEELLSLTAELIADCGR